MNTSTLGQHKAMNTIFFTVLPSITRVNKEWECHGLKSIKYAYNLLIK